jgi:hypothetical protein
MPGKDAVAPDRRTSLRAFDMVLRGYDRRQVDERVEQLENQGHRDP